MRRGRYSLARYGPEQDLGWLSRDRAHDCPRWNERARRYEPRCGIRPVDLDHVIPPRDLPPEPVYRRRQPAREDVPQSRPKDDTYRAPMLSHWPNRREVVIVCRECGRRDSYDRDNLLSVSGDVSLTHLRTASADCREQGAVMEQDRCDTRFEGWPP